jgi:NRPS condensation-like uncharacterized protein
MDKLNTLIAKYVSLEKNVFIKSAPLFIKSLAIRIGFHTGARSLSTVLSNLGIIELPESMYEHISHFESLIYPSTGVPINCGVCSVNDKLTISFARSIIENEVITYFFSYLAENEGIEFTVYSNDWGTDYD